MDVPAAHALSDLQHWIRELVDAPERLQLATDYPRLTGHPGGQGSVRWTLAPDVTKALLALASRLDV